MSDSTRQRVLDDVKTAMKAGQRERIATLRLISAEIKQREVDERRTLDDADMLALLERMGKQRRESIRQYEDAKREDLAARERAELEIIADYLPRALDPAELDALIDVAIIESGAASMRDMGQVMAVLRPRVTGRADMSIVSRQVKQRLGGR